MKQTEIDSDVLQAYVDGQLSDRDAQQVEAFLEANPESAEEVADWQVQNANLRALFPEVDHDIVVPEIVAANKGRAPFAAIAASVAMLAVGGVIGWGSHVVVARGDAVVVAGLVDQAIAAHVVFTSDNARPVEVAANQEEQLIKWLSNRLGQTLAAPDLRAGGFELVGGRLLSDGQGPAAQFMYEDSTGKRITVFASNSAGSRMAEFTYKRSNGVGSFYWQDDSLQYAVVGDVTRAALGELARSVYRQLS